MSHQVKAHTILDTVVYWGAGGSMLGFVLGVTPYLVFLSSLGTAILVFFNIYIKAHARYEIRKHKKSINEMALTAEEKISKMQMSNITADGSYKHTPKEKK